jgi:hypothetical protein
MSLRPQQNIAAAQVGRYGTHATFSSYVLPGPRAKRGPAFSLPHAAVPRSYWPHLVSKRRSGRSPDWLKMKHSDAPAVKREEEEEWGKKKWR